MDSNSRWVVYCPFVGYNFLLRCCCRRWDIYWWRLPWTGGWRSRICWTTQVRNQELCPCGWRWQPQHCKWIFVVFSNLCMFFRILGLQTMSMEDPVSRRIQLGLIDPFWKKIWLWMKSIARSLSSSRLSDRDYSSLFSTGCSSSPNVLAFMDATGFYSTKLSKWKYGISSEVLYSTFRCTTASYHGTGAGYFHSYEKWPFFWNLWQVTTLLSFVLPSPCWARKVTSFLCVVGASSILCANATS